MFGKKKQKLRAPKISTVIGSGTEIRGDIQFSDGLHVDGVIKGDVQSDPQDMSATLTLSELGTIQGNVRVANVMLNGTVVGDVVAGNQVELAPKARITGTLTYALLEMSMGAEVNGKLIHANEQDPLKLEFDGNKIVPETEKAPENAKETEKAKEPEKSASVAESPKQSGVKTPQDFTE
jgi:cytoskeletal protein CcmA (bactofilin family)